MASTSSPGAARLRLGALVETRKALGRARTPWPPGARDKRALEAHPITGSGIRAELLRPVACVGQWRGYRIRGERFRVRPREPAQLAAVREPQPLQWARQGLLPIGATREVVLGPLGGSYYGGGSRPPLNLNRPIMRQRAPSSGYYGGGRSYSAPSGGNHSNSAPKGGGGHSYSAPKSSGGGGGGHSSGGGGGHSSGGGHGGGRR